MRVLFIARKSRKNRELPTVMIYYRVKLDGRIANERSTFVRVAWADWDADRQLIRGDSLTTTDENTRLCRIRSDITRLFLKAESDGEAITAQQLADRYAPPSIPEAITRAARLKVATITTLLTEYRADCEQTYTKRTRQFYRTRIDHIETFLGQHQLLTQPVSALDLAYGQQFIRWMKADGYDNQYIVRHVQVLRLIGSLAVINRHVAVSPFAELKLKKRERRDTTHLTTEQIEALETLTWRPALQRVADLFVFSIQTGLHYADAQTLTAADVRTGLDGRAWLFKLRGKYADSAFFDGVATQMCPLSVSALALIDKYGGVANLPKISNVNYNLALKEIAVQLGFAGKLTVKVARKTFTDRMLNSVGLSVEAVATMLGHSSTEHVAHYARADERRVAKEMTGVAW